jgi:SAM-dependent methyltransferase
MNSKNRRDKMSYILSNKSAWEEAFSKKKGYYAKDMISILQKENNPFLEKPLIEFLDQEDLSDKVIGQFCCNNGRELLSISKRGIRHGYGFDIAKNMITFGNETAAKTQLPVTFIEANILEIDHSYHNQFDYLFITVGALCWFKDLLQFFSIVEKVLKPNGKLIINESHPLVSLLATEDEPSFIKGHEKELVYDYFKTEPWETGSMDYMTDHQELSSKFYSFTHTMSNIITSIVKNKLLINSLSEYDYCIANLVTHLDYQGLPLSYLLVATKSSL